MGDNNEKQITRKEEDKMNTYFDQREFSFENTESSFQYSVEEKEREREINR